MSRISRVLGKPALNLLKPSSSSHSLVEILSQNHIRTFRNFASYSPVVGSSSRVAPVRLRFGLQTVRHCSYRNAMCRSKDGVASASVDVSKGREVLPTNVKPLHYHLTLEPNFEKFTYEGKVVIE